MSNSSKKIQTKKDWGQTPKLTPEQIVEWLDGYREMMFEVWRQDPASRKQWEKINGGSKS